MQKTKPEQSKINMEETFDLKPINQDKEVQELDPESVKQFIAYAEQKIMYNKKIVKNIFNAEFFPLDGETNNKPSMTIPDQTLPIRELLARFAKGLPVGVQTPIYEGDDNELPDPRTLDLVDLQEYKELAKSELQAIAARQKSKQGKPKEEPKQPNLEESKTI